VRLISPFTLQMSNSVSEQKVQQKDIENLCAQLNAHAESTNGVLTSLRTIFGKANMNWFFCSCTYWTILLNSQSTCHLWP
jgi:hypothetical protein